MIYPIQTQDVVADNSGLPSLSYLPSATPVKRLASELDLFKLEYQAMLYSGKVCKSVVYSEGDVARN